jgi:Domain of unknown function (DUF4303)
MTRQLVEAQVQLVSAIRQAATELRGRNLELFGFALCTDDDLRTLYHAACTRDWVREMEVGYPDIGFIYVEWTQAASELPFGAIGRQFARLADDTYASEMDWASARDQRFNLLVSALRECREAGDFPLDTLLCAGSTDPSEHLARLAMRGVDALNRADLANRFARALGYEKHRTAA